MGDKGWHHCGGRGKGQQAGGGGGVHLHATKGGAEDGWASDAFALTSESAVALQETIGACPTAATAADHRAAAAAAAAQARLCP